MEAAVSESTEVEQNHDELQKSGKDSDQTDMSSKVDENCTETETETPALANETTDGVARGSPAVEDGIGVSKSSGPSVAETQDDEEAMDVDQDEVSATREKDESSIEEKDAANKSSESDEDARRNSVKLTTIEESEENVESQEDVQNEKDSDKAIDEVEDKSSEKQAPGDVDDDAQESLSVNDTNDKENEKDDSETNEGTETTPDVAAVAENDGGNNEKIQKDSEQEVECMDVEMESPHEDNDKEEENKKSDVENTEFVQFNQDKDDSQLEAQSEAVDPFAADIQAQTLSDEAMEVDSANAEKISDVIETDDKSKDSSSLEEKDKNTSDKIDGGPDEPDGAAGDSSAISDIHLEDQSEAQLETLADSQKETSEPLSETTKDTDAEPTVANDVPAAKEDGDVSVMLPGQDEELSIIPDSSKNDSSKIDETDKVQDETQKEITTNDQEQTNSSSIPLIVSVTSGSQSTESETIQQNQKLPTTNQTAEVPAESEKTLKVAAITTGANDIQVNDIPDGPSIVTSDIIDLDDDPKNPDIEEIATTEVCKQCKKETSCSFKVKVGTKSFSVCSESCKIAFSNENNKATDIPSEGVNSKRDKRCANCLLIVEAKDERNLSWETMEFCNEECLGKFQTKYGSYCRNCNGSVQSISLGKYCVRFGYDVRQFCCSTCLEEFKKGLKVCSYCQKDISAGTEGFLAPVGDKGQFKDFCTQDCMEKYARMNSAEPPAPEKKVCSVCQEEKIMHCEVQIDRLPSVPICSEPCFAAFKFVNKVDPDQCSTCKKYFQLPTKKGFVVFYEDEAHTFCNKTCLNVFIITNRKIVPCNWCKVKKYNFDMIKKELKTGQVMMMCSLNCLTLYQVSINAVSARRINCDFCKEFSQAQYHLTMSDATIRNFCSYKCVMNFQAQYTKSPITIPTSDGTAAAKDPVPTGIPKRAILPSQPPPAIRPIPESAVNKKTMPVISSVTSLAAIANGQTQSTGPVVQQQPITQQPPITLQGTAPVVYKQQVVTRPTSPVEQGNKMTQCRPLTHTKGVMVRPIPKDQSTQTEEEPPKIMPIPLPFYVPFPMHMYSMPFPVPVPIPLPVPVPVFIPTTRNSIKGIMKEIKRIQEKIPSDPFEAELLMMAEMVATEKKTESDSDSNDEARDEPPEIRANSCSPEPPPETNSFGDDLLQMALKMTDDGLEEPADLENSLASTTIRPIQKPESDATENDAPPRAASTRGRKRGASSKPRGGPSKRGKRAGGASEVLQPQPQNQQQHTHIEPAEKPDANMALKYTFGVNAWRQWVITKNADLEKQSTPSRKLKPFKTELLQLTADELNYSLCLFVKEVRKPNGAEYAPDTIYYLCLGIQQYLFENNRIDNIFTDAYYEKFTDILDEVGKKFTALYSDSLFVVTRVEEEHLWESKQLGAHSPHVLLNTLMYFNTKHFDLQSVEEHKQLSFSHIMKHWKRSPGHPTLAAKPNGSRNVLLRFYPPQSALEANAKKKKVYEQQEDEDNPLRCPVKLYEFYLSKCPESVKTRNDVFYLLPERSCVPDSPVWYSTTPLAQENLVKMLNRIRMVKEINVALLSSDG